MWREYTHGRVCTCAIFTVVCHQRNVNWSHTEMPHYYTAIRAADEKDWLPSVDKGDEGTSIHTHCWGWKQHNLNSTLWQHLKEFSRGWLYDLDIPLLDIYPEESLKEEKKKAEYMNVLGSFICAKLVPSKYFCTFELSGVNLMLCMNMPVLLLFWGLSGSAQG